NFINNVDFEFGTGWGITGRFAQLANLIDAPVAGAIDFQHIQGAPLRNFDAARVLGIKLDLRAARGVQAFGKNAGDSRLPGAARPAKQISVRDAVLLDGVAERLSDMLLPHHVAEALRPVFSGYYLIRHKSNSGCGLRDEKSRRLPFRTPHSPFCI